MTAAKPLDDKQIVVCGGSSGIGLAAAAAFVGLGARVVVVGRSAQRLEAALAQLGEVATARLDCADAQAVDGFFSELDDLQHVVVSLAASAALGPFSSLKDAAFRDTFEGKFWPYINVMRASVPQLAARGSLTLVTGASAIAAAPGAASLSAVNGALEGMIKTLAVELAPIRINAVAPGLTDTPAWSRVPDDIRADMYARAAADTPAGRVGQPEDVAQAIVSCVVNPFITGVVLPCDGGKRLT